MCVCVFGLDWWTDGTRERSWTERDVTRVAEISEREADCRIEGGGAPASVVAARETVDSKFTTAEGGGRKVSVDRSAVSLLAAV